MVDLSSSSSPTLLNSQSLFSARSTPKRTPTSTTITPLSNSVRHKPRRWPLVLRFYKGAIHGAVSLPVLLHSLFTIGIIFLDKLVNDVGVPSIIIPSLSIVVGLMLVFRNQTAYDRFWTGRNLLTECCSCVRNLTRAFLVSSTMVQPLSSPLLSTELNRSSFSSMAAAKDLGFPDPYAVQREDTEQTIKILIATLYAMKHNLRNEYLTTPSGQPVHASSHPEFEALLPQSLVAAEHRGLSLPLQLMVMTEAYIRRGVHRSWFHGPQASQLSVQLNTMTTAYTRMEAIKTTPIPVAHLIHTRQVLALYGAVLPLSLVDGFGWWSVPMVAVLMFTLYGIDGIGSQLEDPFGYDRNDIKMDAIVADARIECMVLLDLWKERVGDDKVMDDEGLFQ